MQLQNGKACWYVVKMFKKILWYQSKKEQEFRGRRWPHWSRIFYLNDRKVPFVFLSMQYLNYWNIVQRSKWNVSTFQGMSKPCVMFWMHAYTWTTITFKVTNMNLNWQTLGFPIHSRQVSSTLSCSGLKATPTKWNSKNYNILEPFHIWSCRNCEPQLNVLEITSGKHTKVKSWKKYSHLRSLSIERL